VPAGTHEVEIGWSSAPLLGGAVVSLVACAIAVLLFRR